MRVLHSCLCKIFISECGILAVRPRTCPDKFSYKGGCSTNGSEGGAPLPDLRRASQPPTAGCNIGRSAIGIGRRGKSWRRRTYPPSWLRSSLHCRAQSIWLSFLVYGNRIMPTRVHSYIPIFFISFRNLWHLSVRSSQETA